MGQQFSSEEAMNTASAMSGTPEKKLLSENGPKGPDLVGSPVQNNSSSAVTPPDTVGQSPVADPGRAKTETDISKMSIRAAIDSFIENCLSTPTDEKIIDLSPQKSVDDSTHDEGTKIVHDFSISGSTTSTQNSIESYSNTTSCENSAIKDHTKSTMDEKNDIVKNEIVIVCDDPVVSTKNDRKGGAETAGVSSCDNPEPCVDIPTRKMDECKDTDVDSDQKPELKNWKIKSNQKENVDESTSGSPAPKALATPEKQSFSAFLQDRLKSLDYDKNEELVQLASSKDIQSQEQMIMWEVTKKPAASFDSSSEPPASHLTSGPVRLQTLIDKVLDSSLSSHGPSSSNIYSRSQNSSSFKQTEVSAHSKPNFPQTSPQDELKRDLSTDKIESAPSDDRPSFKDHIEKILLENLLSYDEDEKRKALRKAGSSGSMETSVDTLKSHQDGTIRVQNIVDQVIQLTHSTRYMHKSTPMEQASNVVPSTGASTVSNNGQGLHEISSHNRALLEAQRLSVQKEHQSSNTFSRKRGRPHLNSTNPNRYPTEAANVKGVQMSNELLNESHSRTRPPIYSTHSSLPHGINAGISPQMSPQATGQSASVIFQQKRHKSSEASSQVRSSLPSPYEGYSSRSFNDFHDHKNQHLSNQAQYPNPYQLHQHNYMQSSKPPPPLILANQDMIFNNSQLLQVAHVPSKSCSCPSCLYPFPRTLPQPADHMLSQQRPFQHQTEQNRASDSAGHSRYNPYPPASPHRSSNENFIHPSATTNDSTVTASNLTSTFEASIRQNRDSSNAHRRELASYKLLPSPSGDPNSRQDRANQSALLDLRFSHEDQHHVPRHQSQLSPADFRKESSNKPTRDSTQRPGIIDPSSAVILPVNDIDTPLDLTVKVSSAQRPDTILCLNDGTDLSRHGNRPSVRTSPSRQPVSDVLNKNKGNNVEKRRLPGPSRDHIQKLENSVDKLLHRDPRQAHQPHGSLFKHSPLPDVKGSHVAVRPDSGREYSGYPSLALQSRFHESPGPSTGRNLTAAHPEFTSHSPLSQQQSHFSLLQQQQHLSLSQQQPHVSLSHQQSHLSLSQQQPHLSLSHQQSHLSLSQQQSLASLSQQQQSHLSLAHQQQLHASLPQSHLSLTQHQQQSHLSLQQSHISMSHQQTDMPMSQQQPHVSMSQQQPRVSMSQQQPHVSMSQQQPHVSMSQHQTHLSMSHQQSRVSMSQQQPYVSMSQQQSRVSMSQQQPLVSMSQQQPHLSMSQQQPHVTISQQKPHFSPSQQQSHLSPSQQQSHLSPSQQQPHVFMSQQQSHMSISQQQPHFSPSEQQSHLSPSQQQPQQWRQQKQPIFVQSQPHENIAPSPGEESHHGKSPGLGQSRETLKNSDVTFPQYISESLPKSNMPAPQTVCSQPSSQASEKRYATTLDLSPGSVSASTHRQDSLSPDDQDSQRLGASKHEPIQNIIGHHAPSDILYLICRLCRQTYGSLYGFRKHVRNQHGFEPNADHTIVHTISATKTAMAHSTAPDLSGEPPTTKDETALCETITKNMQFPSSHLGDSSQSEPTALNGTSLDSFTHEETDLDNRKCLECAECGQMFQLNDFGSYKRHCRQHGQLRSTESFVCRECPRSFSEIEQLREHLLTHGSPTDIGPSMCDICQTSFSTSANLAEHMKAFHTHSMINENRKAYSCHSGSKDGKKPENTTQPAAALTGSAQMRRPNSGSSQPVPVVTVPRSPPLGNQSTLTKTSASHSLHASKGHNLPRLSAKDANMLTVHTPKDLEVQKLPADGIVTTASPDSSYDDARFLLDAQPGSSVSLPSPLSTGTQISNDGDSSKDSHSSTGKRTPDNLVASLSQNNKSSYQINKHHKKEDQLTSPDSGNPVDSNHHSVEDPCTPSVGQKDTFYLHKKYSRHRKRLSSPHGVTEPESKSSKSEAVSPALQQPSQTVSSTVSFAVVVQDCQSSCSNVDVIPVKS